jgi:UDP-N-acetyl-D-glucosamine dehydrogenase
MNKKLAIIGLGYVGLPLAISAVHAGYETVGIDLDLEKIKLMNQGISPIEDLSHEQISQLIESELFSLTSDFKKIELVSVILICVPTPLGFDRMPDLSLLKSALTSIATYLNEGSLLILESTVAPGTTRKTVSSIIMQNSKLGINDFEVAFSPERIDPLNKSWNVENTPKLVAGLTREALENAVQFYSRFVKNIVKCDSLEIAESAKLLENSFRLVNISFINEFSIMCTKLGIDVNKVINAAASKPYGFMPFYPSIGVGGHCIPVDPLYLANKAREMGAPTRFIDLADQINQEMPGYFVGRAEEKMGGLKAKKVLVVGIAYKPNVADVRESPVEALVADLKQKGAEVFWHDDLVKEWNGEKSVALSSNFDLAIIATPHDYLDLLKLGNVPILNTRGSI